MDKQTIVDYVKHTPNNSNPAVLGSLLNQFEDSAGAKLPEVTEEDNGKVLKVVDGEWDAQHFSVGSISSIGDGNGYGENIVFNGELQFESGVSERVYMKQLFLMGPQTNITVEFDGAVYENVPRRVGPTFMWEWGAEYGSEDYDFSVYPFVIGIREGTMIVATNKEDETYHLTISGHTVSKIATECVGLSIVNFSGFYGIPDIPNTMKCDKTFDEIVSLMTAGFNVLFFVNYGQCILDNVKVNVGSSLSYLSFVCFDPNRISGPSIDMERYSPKILYYYSTGEIEIKDPEDTEL